MSTSRIPTPNLSCTLLLFLLFPRFLVCRAGVQAKTDPSEAEALSLILKKWNLQVFDLVAAWNTGDDICASAAGSSNISLDDITVDTGIKCDCSFDNQTTCRIIELKLTGKSDAIIKGQIPEEIKALKMLAKLNLHDNLLSGHLPAFIGNMTTLKYLDLGYNLLSGDIPGELGSLLNLISLNIGVNRFSGSLPAELGNLKSMRKLLLNSVGVSGEIPSTFAQLSKLQTLWLSDNNLSGKIPDFIGSFLELIDLRIHGTFFQGPIPTSFSNLTKLVNLRIGDLKGSSPLLPINDMTSLGTLVLRNSNISGIIPSNYGNGTSLKHLDLSFNNLRGPVPQSLFDLPQLEYLSLGNNHLFGSLPSQKRSTSLFIDLSYNDFSGSFPPWVNGSYNLNLVMNNFTDNSTDSSLGGLRCLQRGFPCNQTNQTLQTGFGVNCGGQLVIDPNGVMFETDDTPLEEIPYKVNANATWAVTSEGKFLDARGASYIQNIQSVYSKTQVPALYYDMRLSASSLRYYGLSLYNGNYTVRLFFGETQDYWDPTRARRLFDIFIQGIRVESDFDITKEASGFTRTAVEKNYTANVKNNFLEIHLFWAGKGTYFAPNNESYGPSITALSVTSDFQVPQVTSATSKNMVPLIAGISAAVVFLCFIIIVGFLIWRRKRQLDQEVDEEFLALPIKPKMYTYDELTKATGNFDPANKLGQGGFGSVYKGALPDGNLVAVKRLTASLAEGKMQFISEVATVSAVQHRNLVKLHGCCCEGNMRLLVYEFLVNRSLDTLLFGDTKMHLDWPTRFKICLGIARGLAYLHEESSIRIIHRDVKLTNILLDADLNPKLSDFGLARPYDDKKSHISTRVAGTVGYLAPEYALRGQLTEKADVFSFGVVALEILCGRPNTKENADTERIYILDWVWKLHEMKHELDMMDPTLSSYDEEEALRVIKVAFMCTQTSSIKRPTMSRVVAMLAGDMDVVEVLSKPSYLLDWRYVDKFSTASTSYHAEHTFDSLSGLLGTIEEGR